MKYSKFLLFIALIALFTQCHSPENKNGNNAQTIVKPKTKDGLYLILNEFKDTTNIHSAKGILIKVNPDFIDKNDKTEPLKLEIDTADFVPLELASKPDSAMQKDKKVILFLALTDTATRKLASFTEKHLNKKVALVIDGMAVTKHKVRTKITDGKVQITRCTDNACKLLYVQLMTDYKKKKNIK